MRIAQVAKLCNIKPANGILAGKNMALCSSNGGKKKNLTDSLCSGRGAIYYSLPYKWSISQFLPQNLKGTCTECSKMCDLAKTKQNKKTSFQVFFCLFSPCE